jgi:beta-galactosidase/beta-glucuronidase
VTWDGLTRWGRELDPDHPWPEYPRPQLVRDNWLNLNGRWEFAFAAAGETPAGYQGEIIVPFSPETVLSGVGRQLQPDEWLWYRRHFDAPASRTGGRVLLHFGAVDQSCTVVLNGSEVGSHTGGYLPFTFEVTDHLQDENTIEVRVRDLSETGFHARGKQRLDRGRIWYTAQSGIWQTVWLETVPREYIDSLSLVPDLEAGVLEVTVSVIEPVEITVSASVIELVEITVSASGKVVSTGSTTAGAATRIAIPDVRPWSPEDPFLYDIEVRLGDDFVTSYVGMRNFGIGEDEAGQRRLLLNGKPYAHVGVLDQGYWPDGLLTAPSDAAMVHDIETMKDLGFTMLRKHVKVEPLRWYHHCDRLGMLVWQDMVNGGGRYRHLVADLPATRPVRLSDKRYDLFFRRSAAARTEFRDEVRQTVELLRNTACVAVWVPFNEGWGQFDANDIAAEVAELDPTRQVNHVSGWIDQGGGDIRSFHSYLKPFRLPSRRWRDKRVLALTEYGGYSLRVDGHDWSDREFGYRRFTTTAELAAAFEELHRTRIAPPIPRGLSATVYTQLSDVEDELNGLLTWDREVLKLDPDLVRRTLSTLNFG